MKSEIIAGIITIALFAPIIYGIYMLARKSSDKFADTLKTIVDYIKKK